MAEARKTAPSRPQFVRHVKRPAWGVGRVTDVYAGLVRVQFSDGIARDFRDDVLEKVDDKDVPPEVRSTAPAVAPRAGSKPSAKKSASTAKAAPRVRKARSDA